MAKKESSIKSFVLRVDAETMDAIEKWAADEFRSYKRTTSVDYCRSAEKERPAEKEIR